MLALYRLAREEPSDLFREAAFLLLRPLLPFDSSIWGAGTLCSTGIVVHSMHLHRQPPEMMANWQIMNHQETVTHLMNTHMPGLSLAAESAGIRHQTLRFGVANALIAGYVEHDLPLVNWISLFRESTDRQFSEDEHAFFEALVPHLVEALTTNRVVNLEKTYESCPRGSKCLAIADQYGVICYADVGFRAVVREEWAAWTAKALPQPILRAVIGSDAREFRGARICVGGRQVGELLFLKARTLKSIDSLTLREKEIARHFGEGRTHKEVARILGISPVTVRNHLQTIYGKLRVRDKAELARLLAESA